MNAIAIDEIVAKIVNLPSLSAVVMELLNNLDQDDADIAILAKKVSHDQALTAKTLSLANSAGCGTQAKITTIQQAISFLGFKTVRNLITTAAMTSCFPDHGYSSFDNRAYWRHSIATAVCAKVLARHLRLNQDIAFTGGLLHDIGRLVLVTHFPLQYEHVLAYRAAHDCHWLDAERAVLGQDHVTTGLALAAHWNFSDTIRLAIAGHHAPDEPGAGSLATIVHIADAIAHALDLSQQEDDLVPPLSEFAWDALKFDEATYLHVFRETELEFDEISLILLQ
jgi:putative nucleotidyltransferase with HDIG domain